MVYRIISLPLIRCHGEIDDLTFRRERLARARHTEDKGIAVEQLPPVGDDHILADHILSIIDAVIVADLLDMKGHEG